MPIDDEVLVGRVFVLAHTGLDQRSALQSRKPKREILARRLEALRCGHALAGRGIEWRPPGVVRDLEPAPLVARNAVDESPAVIGPHRQRLLRKPLVTGGRAEEKDLLPGGAHPVADNVRKQAPEPRAAGEHECIGDEGGAVRQFDAPQLASGGLWTGLRRELAVLAALGEKALEHSGAGPPRREVARIVLEDGPADLLAVDLRVAARGLRTRQLFERQARFLEHR